MSFTMNVDDDKHHVHLMLKVESVPMYMIMKFHQFHSEKLQTETAFFALQLALEWFTERGFKAIICTNPQYPFYIRFWSWIALKNIEYEWQNKGTRLFRKDDSNQEESKDE